jgi:hypothetical protein
LGLKSSFKRENILAITYKGKGISIS